MGTKFWLTDEDSDIAGYKRAKLGARSDACSMVRAVTSTAQGPITIPITRQVGGVPLVWLSDPLNGPSIAELPWEFHLWSVESSTDAVSRSDRQPTVYDGRSRNSPILDRARNVSHCLNGT